MRAHPQRQGFDALQNEEGVERADRGAKVAQQRDARLQPVGDGAERLGGLRPDGAVIAGIGRVQGRLAGRVGVPIEIAAVDDGAADAGAVAAEIFGERIHDHGRAMVERADQQGGGGVVHDERDAEPAADGGHFGDGEGAQLRVGQRFGVIGAGAVVGGGGEAFRVGRVHEADFDAHVLERVGEQVPGAAIQIGGRDDVVADTRQVLHGDGRGRLPG